MRVVVLAVLTVLAWAAVLAAPAFTDEGCPPGQLPSYEPGVCKLPSSYSDLPLSDDQPMRFEAVQVSMVIIYIQAIGVITEDTPRAFEAFLASDDAHLTKDLVLHSGGGNLLAAVQLGEMIRGAGLNTSIGRSIQLEGVTDVYRYPHAYCYSACTYAFLGGVTRFFSADVQFGVHRFGLPEGEVSGDKAQVISAILARYVAAMGVDPAFLQVASSASFRDDISIMSVEDAERFRVIFDPSGQTTFSVEDGGGGAIARFQFVDRERVIRGLLVCSEASPTLVLIDDKDEVPPSLREMVGFNASFMSNSGPLEALASYVPAAGQTPGYVVFRVPDLDAKAFSGEGLELEGIENPHLPRLSSSGNSDIADLSANLLWLDSVSAYRFTIAADNGERTLPLVLRECR